MMMEENFMAMLQFPQPKLVEKTGEGTWRLTGRVILPEDGSLDRAAALLGEDYPALAAAGLSQFLNAVAQGMTPDQAIELLTNGAFTSMADFQAQFTAGTAPGLDAFLTALLLTQNSAATLPPMLALMAGGGGDLGMLMDLLMAMGGSGDGLGALPSTAVV